MSYHHSYVLVHLAQAVRETERVTSTSAEHSSKFPLVRRRFGPDSLAFPPHRAGRRCQAAADARLARRLTVAARRSYGRLRGCSIAEALLPPPACRRSGAA